MNVQLEMHAPEAWILSLRLFQQTFFSTCLMIKASLDWKQNPEGKVLADPAFKEDYGPYIRRKLMVQTSCQPVPFILLGPFDQDPIGSLENSSYPA